MPRSNRWRNIDRLLGFDRRGYQSRRQWVHEEERALLPHLHNEEIDSAIPPVEVTKVCLRLRHLVQECVPCEMEESRITAPHSRIITPHVIRAAKEAGGQEHKGCVVYALLVNQRWFKHEANAELWDAGLHHLRAEACGVIAKALIEEEEDTAYLLHSVLLRRYSYIANGSPTPPVNVIEKAVDLHAVRVIGSSGYQKCISYLWRGWLVQDENDPAVFVDYNDKDNPNFLVHMDPDRMRSPRNQNLAQLLFSLVYLALFTIAINTVNATGVIDIAEGALYIFTLGYICDELLKVYKAGYHILGFWNALNGTLYAFLTASFIFRVVGLTFAEHTDGRVHYSTLGYNILAFTAPLFWCRLLLYLDSFRFFGAMLVVLKVMMKESVIFFALLIVIVIGFLQAFIGLDLTDDNVADDVWFIIESMARALLGSPEFDGFDGFGPPWGAILYYCFTFIVMVILLNILIALYNSAYEDIYENADDEYLALFSQKTMQFIRAPDENVYIAPFNLVEIVISGLFEWWMPKKSYEFLNDCVMGVLYSPLLFITAFFEIRTAYSIRRNRARGEADDDVVEEWEQLADEVDFGAEGWAKKCEAVKPNMEDDPAVVEVKKLRSELAGLKSMLAEISEHVQFPMTSQDTKIGDGSAFGDFKPFSDTTHEGTDHTLGTGKDVAYEQTGTSDSARADQHSLIDLTDPFVDSAKSDDHSAQPAKDSAKSIEDAGENKDSNETIKVSEDPAKDTDEPEPVKSSDEPTKPVEESPRPAEAASESGNATTKAPEDTSQAPEDEPSKGPEDVAFESSEHDPSKAPEDVSSEIPEDMTSKAPEGAPLEAPEYVPFMAPEDLPSETPEGASSEAPEGAPLETPEPSSSKAPAQDVTPERVESEEAEEASPESPAAGEARAEGEQSPAPTKAKRRRRKKNKQSQGGPSGGS
ncbi:Ca2+ permeable channel [Trichoderma parareesei]|uniref:Ca2+ permeable channel n=1 Tax=Trichoderma parareesei TaxID=858221 RepID=A0A2H2ZM08_TRIPA|nr:Ca2+ permeable channel [Trichoderma parareesei]